MKSHTVKSNAKREARKLAEKYPQISPREPQEAAGGGWYPTVETDVDHFTLPAEVIEKCVIVTVRCAAVTADPVPLDDLGDLSSQGTGIDMPSVPAGQGETLDDIGAPSIADPAPEPVAKARRTLDALRALPPRVVSTPEEIRARLDERRRSPRKPRVDAAAKAQAVRDLLARPGGALTSEFCAATGWSHHSVRRFMSQAGIKGTREGKESRYQA